MEVIEPRPRQTARKPSIWRSWESHTFSFEVRSQGTAKVCNTVNPEPLLRARKKKKRSWPLTLRVIR